VDASCAGLWSMRSASSDGVGDRTGVVGHRHGVVGAGSAVGGYVALQCATTRCRGRGRLILMALDLLGGGAAK
jgi:hypothetical protein